MNKNGRVSGMILLKEKMLENEVRGVGKGVDKLRLCDHLKDLGFYVLCAGKSL
jgi:hypothetical protein